MSCALLKGTKFVVQNEFLSVVLKLFQNCLTCGEVVESWAYLIGNA